MSNPLSKAITRGFYLSKEIAEQSSVLERLLESRMRGDDLADPDLGIDLSAINHIVFLAAGTSWHAALLSKRFLESMARIHVEVDNTALSIAIVTGGLRWHAGGGH